MQGLDIALLRNQGCFYLQHVEGGSSKVEWYLAKKNTSCNYIWSFTRGY